MRRFATRGSAGWLRRAYVAGGCQCEREAGRASVSPIAPRRPCWRVEQACSRLIDLGDVIWSAVKITCRPAAAACHRIRANHENIPSIFKILFRRAWVSSLGAVAVFVWSSFEMAKRTPRQDIVWTLYGLKPPMGYRIDAAGSVAYTEDSSLQGECSPVGLS